MSSRAAVFTEVVGLHPDSNTVDVRFGDASRIDMSGTVRVTLPELTEKEARFAKTIAELEVLKVVLTNPWLLRPDYHNHSRQPGIGIAWSQRSLSTIQVSQGATRKALLSVIGSGSREHEAYSFANWGLFWLEGARIRVAKKFSPFQDEAFRRTATNRYALTASTKRNNTVSSPVIGQVEVSHHALKKFASRAGFRNSDGLSPVPEQESTPGSCAATLSRWLMRGDLVRLHLDERIAKNKERRHREGASYWGVPGEPYRFTTVRLGKEKQLLVTVYTRPSPVGQDCGETIVA